MSSETGERERVTGTRLLLHIQRQIQRDRGEGSEKGDRQKEREQRTVEVQNNKLTS